jgi:hypothetical protein
MKYVMNNGALFSISEKDWVAFCKGMAAGEECELPGKLLEFDLIEISKWDREDYTKELGWKEVPSDLPSDTGEKKVSTKKRANKKRSKTGGSFRVKRKKTT